MKKIQVCLNGTESNPFQRVWPSAGLRYNPFPQIGKAEYDVAERQLAKLGGEPIPPERADAYIRETLRGFSDEFVNICIREYQPGYLVKFWVEFPDEEDE